MRSRWRKYDLGRVVLKDRFVGLRVGKINGGMIPGGYALNPSTVRYNGNSNFFSAGTQAHQNWYLDTSKDSVTMGDGRYTIIPS